jgi:NTP pyrophosphatase (non-canonical NTP hydrolase)
MNLTITLGDVIGWIITILSAAGISITVGLRLNINSKKNTKKTTYSRNKVGGDLVGRDKVVGDKYES